MCSLLKLVEIHVDVILSFRCVNHSTQCGVICRFAEGALEPPCQCCWWSHCAVLVLVWTLEGHHFSPVCTGTLSHWLLLHKLQAKFSSLLLGCFLLFLHPEVRERLAMVENLEMEAAVWQKLARHQVSCSVLHLRRGWWQTLLAAVSQQWLHRRSPRPLTVPRALWSLGHLLYLENCKGCWFAICHQVA